MNNVTLFGRLTKDPDLRYNTSGKPNCRITIAVDRYNASKKEKETDFINCTAFAKTAENLANYFNKGNQILIQGNIKTGKYEKDGRTIYTTDVWIEKFFFQDVNKKQNTPTAPQQNNFNNNNSGDDMNAFFPIDDENIPF